MANLKALTQKRISVNKTSKVTRAMEMVSAVKMRKSQERALDGRTYARAAFRILKHASEFAASTGHFLATHRTKGKYGLIVITSDKGLAGSLNSAVIKRVQEFLDNEKYADGDKVAIAIGRRGADFLARRKNVTLLASEENRSDAATEIDMQRITEKVLALHKQGDTRAWYVAYTNFNSTFEQEAVLRRVLPLSEGALAEVIDGIAPAKGKYAEAAEALKGTVPTQYTVEPNEAAVFESVLPLLVNVLVYHALLESKASEHSARMVAMKNATDKAGELSHELMLKFNKARQAAITREVSEITSGIEAMK